MELTRPDEGVLTSEGANPQGVPTDPGKILFTYHGFGPEGGNGSTTFTAHLTITRAAVVVKFRADGGRNGGTRGLALLIEYMDWTGLNFASHSEGQGDLVTQNRYDWITAVFIWRNK